MSVWNEDRLWIGEAAKEFFLFDGHRPHPATLTRWIVEGVKTRQGPIRLEAVKVGSRWVTSRQAIRRFVERQTAARLGVQAAQTDLEATTERGVDKQLDAILGASTAA